MKQEEKPKLGTKKFVIFIYTKKQTNPQPPLEGEEKKFKTLSKNTKLGHLSSTTFFLEEINKYTMKRKRDSNTKIYYLILIFYLLLSK